MNSDDKTDTWVALEAATRNVVVLLRLKEMSGLPCASVRDELASEPWQVGLQAGLEN